MEDVLVVRDGYRLQSWVEIIRERQESGLTNKEFAPGEGSRRRSIITGCERCARQQQKQQSLN